MNILLHYRATAITAEQARNAMQAFVAEHCCYGKAPANDMEIRNIQPSSAYHVSQHDCILTVMAHSGSNLGKMTLSSCVNKHQPCRLGLIKTAGSCKVL